MTKWKQAMSLPLHDTESMGSKTAFPSPCLPCSRGGCEPTQQSPWLHGVDCEASSLLFPQPSSHSTSFCSHREQRILG